MPQEVHLYVEASSAAPRKTGRMAAYVLEARNQGGKPPDTLTGVEKLEETYNMSILHMMAMAMMRINKKVVLHLHSHNRFVLASISQDLQEWKENGYRKAGGEPLKNAEAWERIERELERILNGPDQITVHPGDHEYHSWMLSEMKRKGMS